MSALTYAIGPDGETEASLCSGDVVLTYLPARDVAFLETTNGPEMSADDLRALARACIRFADAIDGDPIGGAA